MEKQVLRYISFFLVLVLFVNFYSVGVNASIESYSNKVLNAQSDHSSNRYYFDPIKYTHNTGKDNGFSQMNAINSNDPHYGWQLGRFYIEGFTDVVVNNGKITILKNVGDKINFGFILEQNIDCLNGDDTLKIYSDEDCTDTYLQVPRQNFERGALFVKKVDYQEKSSYPVEFTNFLEGITVGANTNITMYEEGDYSVALDYEIQNGRDVFGIKSIFGAPILPSYTDYRYAFDFEIRNSNCMAYPMDLSTSAELYDGDRTPNGFALDLARSKYLVLHVKYSQIVNGRPAVRTNNRAQDGDIYNREGIYEISIENPATNRSTDITLFVGNSSEVITYARQYRGEPIQTPVPTPTPTTSPGATVTPTPVDTNNVSSVDDTSAWLDSLELNSDELLDYVESVVYQDLSAELGDEYYIENVDAIFISQDYIDELAYNSQSNIFFGYTLSDLDEHFGDQKYVFTVDDNNKTAVQLLNSKGNTDIYDKMLEDVIIGVGVILVCVTVSAVAGTGTAVGAIFAASASTGAKFAISSAVIGGVT